MTTFESLLKEYSLSIKNNQEKFFNIVYLHLIGDKKYLIAKGGMGLGKTIATLSAIKMLKKGFSKTYIATPFSMIKDEWMKESNRLDVFYSPWISKSNCLSIYHGDINDCNDECEHRKYLESNDIFTDLCYNLTNKFLLECPITASEYYNKHGVEFALWSMIKCGLLNRDVSVGDYIPLFIPSMIQKMVFGEKYNKNNSIIIIDEAQRFIPRVKTHFSKTLTIDDLIKSITQKEIKSINNEPELYSFIINFCSVLRIWRDDMIKSFSKKNNEKKYSYQQFIDMLEINCKIPMKEILFRLKFMANRIEYDKEDDEEKHPQIHRLLNFLDMWKNIDSNHYEQYINYLEFNKKLKLNLTCIDVSDKIPKLLEPYKKVIFMSGTIGESFKKESGLEDIDISEYIKSYNLSENVFIYPKFDFSSEKRFQSLKDIKEFLNEVVETMDGRIILFLPTTQISNDVINILNTKRIFYNCCNQNQESKSRIIQEFTKSKDGILIFGFNQGIEGQNFIDEMNFAVENSIFLGYPFMRKGLVYNGELNYKIKKYGKESAKRLHEYIPVGENIHQCLARTKRNEIDEPVNILIGTQFNRGTPMTSCMSDDLIQNIIYDKINLIEQIKRKNELRRKKRDLQSTV